MAAKETISAEYVRKVLAYDKETGIFRWRNRPKLSPQWNGRYAGSIAGWKDWKGYVLITIDYIDYRAHRLAWVYVTGEWPENDIDHRSRITNDNKFKNLREATRSQNNGNTKARKNNKSGSRGVSWDKFRQKWMAVCKFDGRYVLKKRFDKKSDAIAAYKAAYTEMFGDFVSTA